MSLTKIYANSRKITFSVKSEVIVIAAKIRVEVSANVIVKLVWLISLTILTLFYILSVLDAIIATPTY